MALRSKKSSKRRKRKPRRLSVGYLERLSMYYQERYGSSRSRVRRHMMKRVNASLAEYNSPDEPDFDPGARDEALAMVEEVLEKLEARGVINDEAYARSVLKRLRKKGKSERAIRSYLRVRGVDRSDIDEALRHERTMEKTLFGEREREGEPLTREELELESALTFVRKRRLGHWGRKDITDPDVYRRHLGRLARAGFSYRIAKQALESQPD